jgi:tripeptide aminopeptidase
LKDRITLLEEITRIGAPTFAEAARADFVFQWLETVCGAGVGRDDLGNVWIDLSGGGDAVCLLDAHIDTVFPDRSVAIRKDGERWHAPGIFDNTAACAQLMLWAREVSRARRTRPFVVTFTVGEEGTGDLCGIRAMTERFLPRLCGAMVFDLDLNICSRQAVGSLRYRLQWSSAGGHSWNDFGTPGAIQRAAQWIARLPVLHPWRKGLHSFNIGTIEGGTGINVIAGHAAAALDARSTDPSFLHAFGKWIESPRTDADAPDEVTCIGCRPAGFLREDHPLYALQGRVHANLGLACTEVALSTNGNALLAARVPTLVTGLASGGNIHRPDEYLDLPSHEMGSAKLAALTDLWEQLS